MTSICTCGGRSSHPIAEHWEDCPAYSAYINELWERYNMAEHGMPDRPYPNADAPVSIETAPTVEAVMETAKCSDLNTEWLNTRRGLIGLARVETPRPADLPAFVTWVWFTESGETGMVDGASGRAMAIADAYRAMVRAASGAPAFPWEVE